MLYYILRFGPHPARALGRRTSCPPLRAGTHLISNPSPNTRAQAAQQDEATPALV